MAWLGFKPGDTVREIGFREGIDHEFRQIIAAVTGQALRTKYSHSTTCTLLWFRAEDGRLINSLHDAAKQLKRGSTIVLLTPKAGQDGYVRTTYINHATEALDLVETKTVSAGEQWDGRFLIVSGHR
ncbi:DUF3052 family protein [Streptomyces yunnanensis]|uniref:Uncharacterized protein n=1 Tax=Streptomyces yunnanensis TaxID=156453 RepID=A0A9X8N9U8_9ACTN|nr:DUF3052 family protein [Streptomyces yunnanensis]SHN35903.1 Protein of unknown function [Streptomyces yunnanensis]